MKAHPDLADLLALRSARLGFERADEDLMRRRASDLPHACGRRPRLKT
jgi:hypothetical protein